MDRKDLEKNGPVPQDESVKSVLTLRQKIVFPVLVILYFNSAMIVSMQAPFYPAQATRKNATATEFSLVMATYDIVRVIVTPIIVSSVVRIGIPIAFNIGTLIEASAVCVFGFMVFIESRTWFIVLSVLLRVMEATGASASGISVFSLMGKEFPNSVGTAIGLLESTYGFGLSLGPVVGSLLYVMGGFTLPFLAVGIFHYFMCFLVNILVIRKSCSSYNSKEEEKIKVESESEKNEHKEKYKLMNLVKIPSVMFFPICLAIAASTEGFLAALLEPHLRQFDLNQVTIGWTFFSFAGTYAISAVLMAVILKKYPGSAIYFNLGSGAVKVIGFALLSPLPFLQLPSSFPLVLVALIGLGIAHAAAFISIYNLMFHEAKLHGFVDITHTSALLASLILTAISIGISGGAGMSGLIYDYFGFTNATLVIITPNILKVIGTLIFIYYPDKFRRLESSPRPKNKAQDNEGFEMKH